MTSNKYQQVFVNDFVRVFRRYNASKYQISISGIEAFTNSDSKFVELLLEQLRLYDIHVVLCGGYDSVQSFDVECLDISHGSSFHTQYQIQSIPSLVDLSSKTGIPLVCLIIMKVVSIVICKLKVLYKAVALDLDDTIWKGTLAEIGIDQIKANLLSKEGSSFISFMRFIRILAEELGIFVAICSRNDSEVVTTAINDLDESIFPIKNQIDCIIANNNNKSDNLTLIAQQLSILPGSIVFIDDNKIIRDEVKSVVPDVFVPEWDNHEDLMTTLIAGCIFDRNELSLKSRNRRKQYQVILAERRKNTLPSFPLLVNKDPDHKNSIELYAKSNQFNFSQNNNSFDENTESIFFELYREGGESLGVCSAITFRLTPDEMTVMNWAMSCRFFEIGVEEAVLLYITELAGLRNVFIKFHDSGLNLKVKELLTKYPGMFIDTQLPGFKKILFTCENIDTLRNRTNLRIQ